MTVVNTTTIGRLYNHQPRIQEGVVTIPFNMTIDAEWKQVYKEGEPGGKFFFRAAGQTVSESDAKKYGVLELIEKENTVAQETPIEEEGEKTEPETKGEVKPSAETGTETEAKSVDPKKDKIRNKSIAGPEDDKSLVSETSK